MACVATVSTKKGIKRDCLRILDSVDHDHDRARERATEMVLRAPCLSNGWFWWGAVRDALEISQLLTEIPPD